jgi:cellulose synthase/poly-beta-1,6-N-acetylglucosamine synthase-like glycosyltransferase
MKWVFWMAAALIGYAYLGYPLWLWFRSRWSPRPVRREVVEPDVSAAMVVRNEEAVISGKVANLLALDYSAEKLEIVVISADVARTFVVLNSAAMAAFVNFVTGRKAVWIR